jgi:mannose-6-phosphate isomerase-like protein (cupin superfamily)
MIKSILNAPHYTWGDQVICDGWHLCKTEALSVIQERMPPGSKERLHMHQKCQQLFYILSGIATFIINEVTHTVKAGESIHVLPGQKHFVMNEGSVDLAFLVISEPPSHGDRINLEQIE